MRIFLAINLPEIIKKELVKWQSEIKNSFPMEAADNVAKWVEMENLHLTLLFLGEIKDKEAPFLIKAVETAVKDMPPIALQLTKICYGPKNQLPPCFIWTELGLNAALQKITSNLILEICKEPSSLQIARNSVPCSIGHITLARVKEWVWKRIDPEEQPEIDKEIDLKFTARSIEIMQSQLKRSGPEYSILHSFPLLGID